MRQGLLSADLIDFYCSALDLALQELPRVFRPAVSRSYSLWAEALLRWSPSGIYEELRTLAEESGQGWDRFRRALCAPDLGTFLAGIAQAGDAEPIPQFGCTSVFQADSDGEVHYGRNLDYTGVGIWDSKPLVVVHHPTSGSRDYRTASLGTDGVHFASISGLNEHGLVLMIHQAYTKAKFAVRPPLYALGEPCLRQCRTVSEAVAFFRSHRPVSTWFFVLVGLHEGRAVVVEANRDHFFLRECPQTESQFRSLVQTNHLHQPQREKFEVMTYPGHFNSQVRFQKATDFSKTKLTVESLRAILGHQHREDGRIETSLDILKSQTIQTCLFHRSPSGEAKLWLSSGDAPAATGEMIEISLRDLFSPAEHHRPLSPAKLSTRQLGSNFSLARRNQLAHAELYRRLLSRPSLKTFQEIFRDEAYSPTELLLKLVLTYQDQNYRQVLDGLKKSPHLQNDSAPALPHLKDSFKLLQWLSHARAGELNLAVDVAQKLLKGGVENPLHRHLTSEFLKSGQVPKRAARLCFNFFNGDLDLGQF